MTLGGAGLARPVVKPAPTCSTDIDPAADEAHQEVQRTISADTVDSATCTPRAHTAQMMLTRRPPQRSEGRSPRLDQLTLFQPELMTESV
jgi:hypothetical protein